MLGKILKLFVGDKSKKDLKLINPIIEEIHSFEQEMNSLSNDELRNQTTIFKAVKLCYFCCLCCPLSCSSVLP